MTDITDKLMETRYTLLSIFSFVSSIPMAQVNQILQAIALFISIVAGVVSIIKTMRKK